MKKDKFLDGPFAKRENYSPKTSPSNGISQQSPKKKSGEKKVTYSMKTEVSEREILKEKSRDQVRPFKQDQLSKTPILYFLPLGTLTLNTAESQKKYKSNLPQKLSKQHLELQSRNIKRTKAYYIQSNIKNYDLKTFHKLRLPLLSQKILCIKSNFISRLQILKGSKNFLPYEVTLIFLLRRSQEKWRQRCLITSFKQIKNYTK